MDIKKKFRRGQIDISLEQVSSVKTNVPETHVAELFWNEACAESHNTCRDTQRWLSLSHSSLSWGCVSHLHLFCPASDSSPSLQFIRGNSHTYLPYNQSSNRLSLHSREPPFLFCTIGPAVSETTAGWWCYARCNDVRSAGRRWKVCLAERQQTTPEPC